jgi:F5/8 type C domain
MMSKKIGKRNFGKRLVDFFWANELHRDRGTLGTDNDQQKGYALDRAAVYIEGARTLCDARSFEPALAAYQDAVRSLAHLALLNEGVQPPSHASFNELMALFLQSSESERLPPSVAKLLSRPSDQEAALPPSELRRRCEAIDSVLDQWLFDVPTRSLNQLRLTRVYRISTFLLCALLLPIGYQAWRLYPRNLARNRPVSASSIDLSTDPRGLVDGHNYSVPGFVSNKDNQPWVSIDLGEVYMVTDAKVTGPHYCCSDESMPLAFEVSVDGKTYQTVTKKTDAFVSLVPWVVPAIMLPARYVRLRSLRRTRMVLTELTVYGRPLH